MTAANSITHPHIQWKSSVNPWVIAVTVMLATFMEVLDTSIANVALPHIAGNLSAGVDESTWVLTSYLVSNAIVLPLSGWFSRIFGRKNFYMCCVAIFSISSLACGLAPNIQLLLLFRVLQGLGGGALQPISQAILFESFPKEKQGLAMGVFGMGVVFAPVIGPTLGGWITDNYSWRWIFLINVPVGVLSIFLTTANVEDPPYIERKTLRGSRIDYIGLGLLSIGLASLQIMLDKGEREDWFDSKLIVTMGVLAAVGILGAIAWELRHDDPVVDFKLLRNPTFLSANVIMFVVGAVLYGSTTVLPLMLQTLMGYNATAAGEVLSPGGLITLVMMPIAGILVSKMDARVILVTGLGSSALALLFYMGGFNLSLPFHTAVLGRVYQSFGLALIFVPLNSTAFSAVGKLHTNNASGIINLARNIGGSVGISLCQTLISQRSQVHQALLAGQMSTLNPHFQVMFSGIEQTLLRKSNPGLATEQSYAVLLGMLRQQAGMLAYLDTFRIMGLGFLLCIPLVFLLKPPKKGGGAAGLAH